MSWTYTQGQEKNDHEEYNGRKGSHARHVIFDALKRASVLWDYDCDRRFCIRNKTTREVCTNYYRTIL